MNFQYDVVVVGAGPVGLATACSIKTLNPAIQIAVLDKHTVTTRNHALTIDAEATTKIHELFLLAVQNCSANVSWVKNLNQFFEARSGRPIQVAEIVEDLTKKAGEMGGITICRGPEYEVKEDQADSLFQGKQDATTLQKIFRAAKVIIGADGKESAIRKSIMQNQLTDQKSMGQWVELSYQTSENQPVALQIKIDEETLKDLKRSDDSPWTLDELEQKGKIQARIQRVYERCQSYLVHLESRKETYHSVKLSTHKISIFRSKDSFKIHKEKHVFLVGDAESQVPLEKGFSKGLQSAAMCAYLVNAYLSAGEPAPALFEEYADTMKVIFDIANGWIPPDEPPPPSNNCVLL